LVSALPSPNHALGKSPADITKALDNEHNEIFELLAANPPIEDNTDRGPRSTEITYTIEGRIRTNIATLINWQRPMYESLEAALNSVFGERMGPFSHCHI